jgi:hypothetical protein
MKDKKPRSPYQPSSQSTHADPSSCSAIPNTSAQIDAIRRLPVRVLDAGPLGFAAYWAARRGRCVRRPEHSADACRRFRHPQDMGTGGSPGRGVCAVVDVHYLSTGGAQGAGAVQRPDRRPGDVKQQAGLARDHCGRPVHLRARAEPGSFAVASAGPAGPRGGGSVTAGACSRQRICCA